jgi:hypothetical protein
MLQTAPAGVRTDTAIRANRQPPHRQTKVTARSPPLAKGPAVPETPNGNNGEIITLACVVLVLLAIHVFAA